MKYLGIDYGAAKVGFALGNDKLATPHLVHRYEDHFDLLKKVLQIVEEEEIKEIVVGVSEGVIAKASKNFAEMLMMETKLPVHLSDETLTTQDANEYAIVAGISQLRRKRMEDAFAATIILQRYLEDK